MGKIPHERVEPAHPRPTSSNARSPSMEDCALCLTLHALGPTLEGMEKQLVRRGTERGRTPTCPHGPCAFNSQDPRFLGLNRGLGRGREKNSEFYDYTKLIILITKTRLSLRPKVTSGHFTPRVTGRAALDFR